MHFKTQEQELQEAKLRFMESEKAIAAKWRVLENISSTSDNYYPPSVFYNKLYGSVGQVHFGFCNYETIRAGTKDPDRKLLTTLLAKFKPEPLLKISDACTSFQPAVYIADRICAGHRVSEDHIYECDSIIVEIHPQSPGTGPGTAIVKWYAYVPTAERENFDMELWRFEVDGLLSNADFGDLSIRYRRKYGNSYAQQYGSHGQQYENREIESCEISTKHDAQRIRWANGDNKTPNHFTLYWDRDSGAALDFPAILFAKEGK